MSLPYFFFCFSGTVGNGVRIYDVRRSSGSIEPILSMKSRTGVNSLSWSPNGHLLAGGCESGAVHLWDIRHPNKALARFTAQDKNPVQVTNLHRFLGKLKHDILKWTRFRL